MKILFIVTRADTIGGVQVHVRDMSRALIKEGHEAIVLTGAEGLLTKSLASLGIPFYLCPSLQRAIHPLRDLLALQSIYQTIGRLKPDIVSTHSSKSGILGRLACWFQGVPCLFTAHGWAFTEGVPETEKRIYGLLERLFAPLAKRIVCVSEHDVSIAIANGISAKRLLCIHNGMPDIPSHLRAQPGSSGKDGLVHLVMVARFDNQKDHATLLQACSELPMLHLDLIGDGPNLENMQTLALKLGIADRVSFLGFRDDVGEMMSKAHLFGLISHWEGFPRSTLEAMRAGLPVIVSNAGGSAEAVLDGVTGFTVQRGDIIGLREKLRILVEDRALRQAMGQAARERYESEFTFDHMFKKNIALYNEVLQKSSSPGGRA